MQYTTEQINNLQKALRSMYQDNLEFLKIYDKKLSSKILKLSDSIDKGTYTARYELEFDNGSFNILDKKKDEYLYEKSLKEYSNEVFDYLDYTNKGSIVNLPESVYDIEDVKELRLFDDDNVTKSFKRISQDIIDTKTHFNHKKIKDEKVFKYFSSFVFFGTLLGQHFQTIQNKYNCKSYLIVEPDLELFRLSLFVNEYKILTKDARLFFSVAEDDQEMIKTMEQFVLFDSFDNYIYKYYSTSYHKDNLFKNFSIALENLNPRSFDHYRQLHYFTQSIKNFKKFPMLVNNDNENELADIPVLILSPGPSLRENFDWIKKNHKKFIIVSFAATLNALSELGVKPDIITSVEASTIIVKQFPQKNKKIYKDSIAILSSDTHDKIFNYFDKEKVLLFEPNFKILDNGLEESPSLTVGETTVHILLSLGFRNLYLLGTDLSFDLDGGSSYDKTHMRKDSIKNSNLHHMKKNIKRISNKVEIDNNYVEVKSNFDDRVLYADQLFLKILVSYKDIISHHKEDKEINVYNLSSGAFIEDTIPLKTEACKVNKKKFTQADILDLIKLKSRKKLSSNERFELDTEYKFVKNLIKKLEEISSSSIKDIEEFYNIRKKFAKKISGHESYSLLTMTMSACYIKTIDVYLNYILNDKNYVLDEVKLNSLKNEWCGQFKLLLTEYLKGIKQAQT